jgi:outer membrane protein OmpA-like peptidoglycan-associated protein
MSKQLIFKPAIPKAIATAVVLALSATAYADEGQSKRSPSKETKWGMATGAAAGALIGGPFGAAVGFIVGTITGNGIGEINGGKRTIKSLEDQLAGARSEFEQLAAKNAEGNAIVEALAQRLHADVLFRTASAELDPVTAQKLGELGSVLGSYSDLTIEIDGYADPRGKSENNDELSQRRALAVRAALITGGAAPDRIKIAAHGEKLSTATKDDLDAYAWERRVSLSVIPKTPNSKVAQAQ